MKVGFGFIFDTFIPDKRQIIMKTKPLSYLMTLAACASLVASCGPRSGSQQDESADTTAMERETQPEPAVAVAKIEPLGEDGISGTVTFTETAGQVHMVADVKSPGNGTHAIHIHEFGDCSAPDGKAAGGHWNPTNEDHGKWGEPPFHRGDIGNIEIGKDGAGKLELTTDLWSVTSDDTTKNVIGKAIIVHEMKDDFKTQPTGNAGARYGCGVIEPQ